MVDGIGMNFSYEVCLWNRFLGLSDYHKWEMMDVDGVTASLFGKICFPTGKCVSSLFQFSVWVHSDMWSSKISSLYFPWRHLVHWMKYMHSEQQRTVGHWNRDIFQFHKKNHLGYLKNALSEVLFRPIVIWSLNYFKGGEYLLLLYIGNSGKKKKYSFLN